MKKILVLTVIAMLILLSACGEKQMQAKPLSSRAPTAAATSEPAPEPTPELEPSSGKTAAEAIKELQIPPVIPKSTVKQATTGMPPAPEGVTGKDALAARSHALYSQGSTVPDNLLTGGVITDFPNYQDESNLPEEYQQGGQYE